MERSECHPTRAECRSETSKEESLPREDCSVRYTPDDSLRHHRLTLTEALDGEIGGCFVPIRSYSDCTVALLSSRRSSHHLGGFLRSLQDALDRRSSCGDHG